MAKDAVEKIKAAEDEAQKIVADAKDAAKQILNDAKSESKSFLETEEAVVREEALKKIKNAEQKGEEEISAYLEANKHKNDEKMLLAAKNKEKAIAKVIELLF